MFLICSATMNFYKKYKVIPIKTEVKSQSIICILLGHFYTIKPLRKTLQYRLKIYKEKKQVKKIMISAILKYVSDISKYLHLNFYYEAQKNNV